MDNQQLTIDFSEQEKPQESIYYNGLGQPLPWEDTNG